MKIYFHMIINKKIYNTFITDRKNMRTIWNKTPTSLFHSKQNMQTQTYTALLSTKKHTYKIENKNAWIKSKKYNRKIKLSLSLFFLEISVPRVHSIAPHCFHLWKRLAHSKINTGVFLKKARRLFVYKKRHSLSKM